MHIHVHVHMTGMQENASLMMYKLYQLNYEFDFQYSIKIQAVSAKIRF